MEGGREGGREGNANLCHILSQVLRYRSMPRNSFFLVVANFCYQVQDQVAKLILW